MSRFVIDHEYLVRVLVDLLNTPSPTGDTEWAVNFVQQELEELGMASSKTTKGALVAVADGLGYDRPRAVSAHVDTLGLMVAEIKSNGRLRCTALNGIMWPTVESEGVTIRTRDDRPIRGSIVFANGAAHVNKDARTASRDDKNLEVRIDERTSSAEETRVLGIQVGDFVHLDPRVEHSRSGYVRSRFLDDKAAVACILAALKSLRDHGITPAQQTHVLISNFEEVGHGGMDSLPDNLSEYVCVDMAALGEGLQGDEHHCTLCVKDSNGPYSRKLSGKLMDLADRAGIDLKLDVYPHYGSDGGAYWFSGGRAEVALIGPGVDTSHGYERTHVDALNDTALLLAEYLASD
jgi:putative aminopeptidase FrvX